MTKLCECGHKKTDHYPRGSELALSRANCEDVKRCHAHDKDFGRCECMTFSGVW